MKINKAIYYLFGASVLMTSVSCSDFLDTEPITEDAVSIETPLKSKDDADKRMNTIYTAFGNEYWQLDYFFNGDAQTEISYAGADNVQNFQQDEYRILSTNPNVERDWKYIYGFINDCNMILNYVDEIKDPALTSARKAEMKSEAAIFRALYYFHAVQLWGDIPLVTKAVIGVNADNFDEVYSQIYPARKPVAEVYNLIISDLEGALANAPASSEKYRVNKNFAYGLLAKAYATKPNPDWAKVKQYTSNISGVSLLPVYDQLFDGNHEANAESIFEADGNAGTVWAWGSSMFYGTDWKKFNVPSNDLVKAFNDEGDTQRLNSSVKFLPVSWSDKYWTQSNHYPFLYKMRKTDGTQNFYILRYADIILLQAEAGVRTGDFTGAAGYLNQVRTRVGLAPVTISSETDGIGKVLNERKLELAFEGHRWFDLKRTGAALSVLSQQKDGNGNILPYAGNINQNRLLWPIPQGQRDNNQNLTQNPGY
ncbi:RagB/SusD family nutrient uptake outer membrane protein [Chryseobacterium jejuense]|uniref:Starch-binding associating with outer membrane n=1 Tax=Chryseobacterium jejuense TaxID=445960 RepID=A0A2X2V7Q7_CHRJE|nr:RagB/SusD family nutrient uptake outer membrane protein [Chryseobacterium jejuense]SDI34861.1 Starch-binding associating with outer membrane [Chryseobacterium jejuense]SQB26782.1 SusD family [Chryseobacterium jejuense]